MKAAMIRILIPPKEGAGAPRSRWSTATRFEGKRRKAKGSTAEKARFGIRARLSRN